MRAAIRCSSTRAIDAPAPHDTPEVCAVGEKALRDIRSESPAISRRDGPDPTAPAEFPREAGPIARNADEWVTRAAAPSSYCGTSLCRVSPGTPAATGRRHRLQWTDVANPTNMRTQWMARATFDHAPHLMVQCPSCLIAEAEPQHLRRADAVQATDLCTLSTAGLRQRRVGGALHRMPSLPRLDEGPAPSRHTSNLPDVNPIEVR